MVQDRRYHVRAVLSDTHPRATDGSSLRLDEKNTREYISITEILCEYYEKSPNEIFTGREKLITNIKRALKELGYKANGRKYIGGYKQQMVFMKKINIPYSMEQFLFHAIFFRSVLYYIV